MGRYIVLRLNIEGAIIYEASGILILAAAAYVMSLKDEISLRKLKVRKSLEDQSSD